jgi:cathepsin E
MLSTSLLSFLSLAILVSANPVVVREPFITLPLAKQFNITSADHILKADQARAAALIDRVRSNASGKESKRAVVGVNVENQAVTYVANVNVGNPATSCTCVSKFSVVCAGETLLLSI